MLNKFSLLTVISLPVLVQANCDFFCKSGLGQICEMEQDVKNVLKNMNNSCPDWVKKLKNVPKCPPGGVSKLPEYYPTIAYILNGYTDGYGAKIKDDISKFGNKERESIIFDTSMGSYYENRSAGGAYLRDGLISSYSTKEKGIHLRTNILKDDALSKDMNSFFSSCGFKVVASHDKSFPEPHEMGGNLISPVPGICAVNYKDDLKNFTQFGCNEENTIGLDPQDSNWGGVNHIDEKISAIPNPRSKKKPPCNFSLVVQSPRRTIELLEQKVKDKKNSEALFFDIDKISEGNKRENGPYIGNYFTTWDEAPGVRKICNTYRSLPLVAHFPVKAKMIIEKFKVTYGASKYSFKTAYVRADEIENIRTSNAYFHLHKAEKTYTTKDESSLTQAEVNSMVESVQKKPCSNLTNSDVLKVYRNDISRIDILQDSVDKFLESLKQMMAKTNNVCGDGKDLDIIYTPYLISNEFSNPTNLLITSDKSIAYPSSLSNLFEADLQAQFGERGVFARELPEIYTRLLKVKHGQDESGGLHCLTNSIQICTP